MPGGVQAGGECPGEVQGQTSLLETCSCRGDSEGLTVITAVEYTKICLTVIRNVMILLMIHTVNSDSFIMINDVPTKLKYRLRYNIVSLIKEFSNYYQLNNVKKYSIHFATALGCYFFKGVLVKDESSMMYL